MVGEGDAEGDCVGVAVALGVEATLGIADALGEGDSTADAVVPTELELAFGIAAVQATAVSPTSATAAKRPKSRRWTWIPPLEFIPVPFGRGSFPGVQIGRRRAQPRDVPGGMNAGSRLCPDRAWPRQGCELTGDQADVGPARWAPPETRLTPEVSAMCCDAGDRRALGTSCIRIRPELSQWIAESG